MGGEGWWALAKGEMGEGGTKGEGVKPVETNWILTRYA